MGRVVKAPPLLRILYKLREKIKVSVINVPFIIEYYGGVKCVICFRRRDDSIRDRRTGNKLSVINYSNECNDAVIAL